MRGLYFYIPGIEEDMLHLLSTDLQLWVNLGHCTWPTIQEIKIRGQAGEENILLDRKRIRKIFA